MQSIIIIDVFIEGGNRLMRKIYIYRKEQLGLKCGFSILLNVADMGLSIAHVGTIVVSEHARLGKDL